MNQAASTEQIPVRTLADLILFTRTWPSIRKDMLLVTAGSLLVAASARVAIHLPFTPVPITGQTFAVLLVGMALGARRGAMALALYLAEGAAGLPVFSGGAFGAIHLAGATAGYLWSYPAAAGLAGWLAERGWDRRPVTTFGAMLLCSALILFSGVLWLQMFVGGFPRALLLGVAPFLPGDVLKALMASACLPLAWRSVGQRGGLQL